MKEGRKEERRLNEKRKYARGLENEKKKERKK